MIILEENMNGIESLLNPMSSSGGGHGASKSLAPLASSLQEPTIEERWEDKTGFSSTDDGPDR